MTDSPAQLAETYFEAWQAKDFDRLRTILADDATFVGPMGTAANADECIAGLRGMSSIMTDIVVLTRQSDADDVVTVFELHTQNAPPCLTANWSHAADGKIAAIRVMFDPRPLLSSG